MASAAPHQAAWQVACNWFCYSALYTCNKAMLPPSDGSKHFPAFSTAPKKGRG
jgi:hypothetical protein